VNALAPVINAVQPTPCGRHSYQIAGPRRGQSLTAREEEVMRLICDAKTKKEIAAELFVTVKTIEKHCVAIHIKWGCRNKIEVLKYAVRNGYYDLRVWEGNPS
jgi:DNA-binding NarL/FixJ family response regulator